MIDEGNIKIPWRKYGPAAFLRRKQWWSFEGLDQERGVYFVFLAMQSFPTGYVALTAIDTNSGQRTAVEHLVGIKAMPGDSVSVSYEGKWGRLHFRGRAEEKWQVEIDTAAIKAKVIQTPRGHTHRNRLRTKTIDYSILQSVRNDIEGTISINGNENNLSGFGYYEHAWGIQARLSIANWLHFWSPQVSGVVMDCQYDAGIPHNYTLIQMDSQQHYLHAPAAFSFNPDTPQATWEIKSPDLHLTITPIHEHRVIKKIPPVFPYIDINYQELLVKIQGESVINGATIPIVGTGKYDHNINKW